jgi:hypothetical protein
MPLWSIWCRSLMLPMLLCQMRCQCQLALLVLMSIHRLRMHDWVQAQR